MTEKIIRACLVLLLVPVAMALVPAGLLLGILFCFAIILSFPYDFYLDLSGRYPARIGGLMEDVAHYIKTGRWEIGGLDA